MADEQKRFKHFLRKKAMINESIEKEFARYSLRLKKNKTYNSSNFQPFRCKNSVWITAVILSLFILTLGIIVGISITPKSAIYSQKNGFLSKYCEFVRW